MILQRNTEARIHAWAVSLPVMSERLDELEKANMTIYKCFILNIKRHKLHILFHYLTTKHKTSHPWLSFLFARYERTPWLSRVASSFLRHCGRTQIQTSLPSSIRDVIIALRPSTEDMPTAGFPVWRTSWSTALENGHLIADTAAATVNFAI